MDRPQSKQVLLIVDADPENIDHLKTILTPDFNVNVAADGREAIRSALSPDPPGLILLNIMTPSGDTYEVCGKLKADITTKDIPIILISAPTTEDTEAEGKRRQSVAATGLSTLAAKADLHTPIQRQTTPAGDTDGQRPGCPDGGKAGNRTHL